MAKIICIANRKGGTGKTTTALNMAGYLAGLGKYVLVVDLDPQGNATSGFGLHHQEMNPSLYHVLIGERLPEEAIKKTSLFGVEIIPSSPDLAGAAVELVNLENREFRLYEALRRIRTNYDFILVDSPPSLGLLTLNGLVAADQILIPVQCEYYAMEGLGQLLEAIEMVKANLGRDISVVGAVLTMFDRRNRLDREVAKEVRRNFPGHVFTAVIPRNVELAEAPSFGKTILQYDPESKGALAYRALAEELVNLDQPRESQPRIRREKKKGLFASLLPF